MSEPSHLSEPLLKAILENAVDSILMIDRFGTILSANPATERMFGYAIGEMLGQNVSMLMPSPYREEHNTYIDTYLTTRIPKIIGLGREAKGQRKDGSVFPLHLAVSEIVHDNEIMFAGIIRDISDLKEVERQLAELNQSLESEVQQRTQELHNAQSELVRNEKLALLGQVSANISHEIRNPLNAAKTSTYFLMNAESPPKEKMNEHLERIDRQIEMIANVVTALTDLAKLPEPQGKALDVAQLVHQTLDSMDLPPEIQVSVSIAPDLPAAIADEYQIAMVLRNLVRNARDAMPDGGQLNVHFDRDGDHVAISVADTGTGIASQDLARIMEPFYSTKARGMGLGLAIIRAILQKNGGRIEVDSELGRGSHFRFYLPVARN